MVWKRSSIKTEDFEKDGTFKRCLSKRRGVSLALPEGRQKPEHFHP